MGIRLVTEVLDRYHGPDARKLWLLAWAEKANDRTRAGWPTREVLSLRTGRSPSRVSHISDELVTEGVLKRDGGGNRSGPARFILLPLAAPVKGAPSPHSSGAVKGAPEPHSETGVKGAPREHPKSDLKGAESAGKGADPSPLPAEILSLPLTTTPSEEQPSEDPSVGASAPTAQTILANFIDWVRGNGGSLTERTKGILARQIADLLAQEMGDRHIRQGLADWWASDRRQHPSTFDSFADAAANAAARKRAALNGTAPSGAPGPDRARGWVAAGRAYQEDADQAGKELST